MEVDLILEGWKDSRGRPITHSEEDRLSAYFRGEVVFSRSSVTFSSEQVHAIAEMAGIGVYPMFRLKLHEIYAIRDVS